MFSFSSKKELFDLEKYVRRLTDLTSPNLPPSTGDSRANHRQNRVLPAILVPYEDDDPVLRESVTVLIKDVSDHGVGVVLHQPFRAQGVVIGQWLPEEERPWFFRGEVRQNSPIGGGYWVLGIELTAVIDMVKLPWVEKVLPLVKKLLPPEPQVRPSELMSG